MTMKVGNDPDEANFRTIPLKSLLYISLILSILGIKSAPIAAGGLTNLPARPSDFNHDKAIRYVRNFDFESLRLAITDLIETFGQKYPKGQEYLEHLDSLKNSSKIALSSFNQDDDSTTTNLLKLAGELEKLKYDALLSNPLLAFDKLLLLKRKRGQLGLPVNHKCNSGIEQTG